MSEETLAQRALRNQSGEVLRRVVAGESFVITNDGVPVARLVPVDAPAPGLRISRPAKRVGDWSSIKRVQRNRSTAEMLDELREDRL
ncbi:MAG: type II toxin-antitoxin system prevent-host-death family antitoxin [Microlunatus sp.]